MSYKSTDFPQYRKLSNQKVFYRIRSEKEFDEIQLVGSKAFWFTMTATQYPEMLRIMDLLGMSDSAFQESTKDEFETLMKLYELGTDCSGE